MECLTSFDKDNDKKPSQVIRQCIEATERGLNPAEEAIVYSLLVRCYARQRQLEMAKQEVLHAREAVGKLIGLQSKDLSDWVQDREKQRSMDWRGIIDDKVDTKEYSLLLRFLGEIVLMLRYPEDFREDLSEIEKEETALEVWGNFPEERFACTCELLGDGWAAQGRPGLAIKWLKDLVEFMVDPLGYQGPFWEIYPRTKLGMQYQQKGKKGSAGKEYRRALEVASHPELPINEILAKPHLVQIYMERYPEVIDWHAYWRSLIEHQMGRESTNYWWAKAKRGFAETE